VAPKNKKNKIFYMRIINKRTSSSCESGQTKVEDDFDPARIEDKASDLAFFGFNEPSLRTSNDDTPISPSLFCLDFVFSFSSFFSSCSCMIYLIFASTGLRSPSKAERFPWL